MAGDRHRQSEVAKRADGTSVNVGTALLSYRLSPIAKRALCPRPSDCHATWDAGHSVGVVIKGLFAGAESLFRIQNQARNPWMPLRPRRDRGSVPFQRSEKARSGPSGWRLWDKISSYARGMSKGRSLPGRLQKSGFSICASLSGQTAGHRREKPTRRNHNRCIYFDQTVTIPFRALLLIATPDMCSCTARPRSACTPSRHSSQ